MSGSMGSAAGTTEEETKAVPCCGATLPSTTEGGASEDRETWRSSSKRVEGRGFSSLEG